MTLSSKREWLPLKERGPLRVLFAITSMPVGGAETLLVNLCRNFKPDRVRPEICCLKEPGPLGEAIASAIPVHSHFLASKWDVGVLWRLRRLIRKRSIDAIVTVGAGDKMFWGRLAAWLEGLPVICSALHSTGWPDGVGRLNRLLTPLTDAFIAVAQRHGEYLADVERFPESKVHVIPNGIDIERFRPCSETRRFQRARLGFGEEDRVVGIVAALRPEKNHEMFLKSAALVQQRADHCRFLIVGDGPERARLEALTASLQLGETVRFLGNCANVSEVLPAIDVFALTSHNEANPVSILEAMACGLPVVATNVGSISQMVQHGRTGFLTERDDVEQAAGYWTELLLHPGLRWRLGTAGREIVRHRGSLGCMVDGYESLLRELYELKIGRAIPRDERRRSERRQLATHR